ncbi:FMN-binding negative transcriptional regulator [Haliea sp. E1-2-M8]|uniref:FMN-binding negative transcriptional regulator n=1 Tax=Haliea sp. E1-2-M8 TaxID=3064706 RepID=UPI00271F32ED|nr:FMN-binding negative transcriptional regulator [Haliea sp. E1-2-M8]MDO8860317.1 FMN-binding negative transcriptional regulator [Haliea sp. E1-2-M8]
MYVPDHFKIDDTSMLQQYIREYGFGLLIFADDSGIEAHHVPFLLDCGEDESLGTLQCHVARKNEVWQRMDDAPSDYTGSLVQAIVGIEITIGVLTGKLKASQNQPERNRAGVKAGLEAGDGAHSLAMSRLID